MAPQDNPPDNATRPAAGSDEAPPAEVPPPEVLPPHAPPRPEPMPPPPPSPAPAPQPELPPPITPPPEIPAPIVSLLQAASPAAPSGAGEPTGESSGLSSVGRSVLWGLLAGALVSALMWPLLRQGGDPAPPRGPALPVAPQRATAPLAPLPSAADFGTQHPSADARRLADWVARSGDNAGKPFLVVDKRHARLYVFDGQARLSGASTVLVGTTVGDDTVPGVGDKPIAQVALAERTTPAGRFMAQRGRNAGGEDVVWVDYAAAVSMHRVRTTVAAERRLQRLASSSLADKRITYGCINVPAAFYDAQVDPVFARQRALVYVLPETKPLEQVFPGVAARQASGI